MGFQGGGISLQISLTWFGIALSLLIMLLFSGFRVLETAKQRKAELTRGEILNAVGFGLLPGIAAWKVFETNTPLSVGTEGFVPLNRIPFIMQNGSFAVSRTETGLAVLCFAAILLWLMIRKEDLPGNGDLLLTVLCLWGLVRAFTEGFRETTLIRAGRVNLTQIFMLAVANIPMLVWTIRMENAQKGTAFSVLEWIAVLSCEAVMVLNTADILSAGSRIGDMAVNAGCMILCMLLMLLTGKDSRS